MTQSARRPSFRLPWSNDEEEAPAAAGDAVETPETSAAPSDPTTVADGSAGTLDSTETPMAEGADAPAAPAEDAASPTPPPAADDRGAAAGEEGGSEFLRSLVDAMRGVADEERTGSVADLRSAVDARVEELESHATERADELRRTNEMDIAGVGDWAKAEIERINTEAAHKVAARRQQLEQQLADHATRSEAEVTSVRERVATYERDLDAYFAQLVDISDPASFVAAARRMPKPPSLEATGATPAPPVTTPTASLNARLAELGIDRDAPPRDEPAATPEAAEAVVAAGAVPEVSATESETPSPAARDAQLADRLAELDARPAPSTATTPTGTGEDADEVATAIMVKGLGSFGAITSFKQRLERLATVRGVTLSLGPTGEFVYRATHARHTDLVGAITALEPGSTVERQADGSLRITVQAR